MIARDEAMSEEHCNKCIGVFPPLNKAHDLIENVAPLIHAQYPIGRM